MLSGYPPRSRGGPPQICDLPRFPTLPEKVPWSRRWPHSLKPAAAGLLLWMLLKAASAGLLLWVLWQPEEQRPAPPGPLSLWSGQLREAAVQPLSALVAGQTK